MVRKLVAWSLDNALIVLLLAIGLLVVGVYSFLNVNVEAYPDPAPPTVEVIALFPGASAEEVERQVTIPLELALAGMPGLHTTYSKSVFGLCDIKVLFNYNVAYKDARQETINRLQATPPLPAGVTPQISPNSATGEIYRYVLRVPQDAARRNIYTLNDLKALQDWVLERELREVPRVVGVTSWGGTIRRYEVQPDPDRMRRYGITLRQLQNTLAGSNATVGGDFVNQGDVALTVRSVGLIGGGEDPVRKVLGMTDPVEAARILRGEEERRIREIRALVITSINNQPILVEDVVEGGRLSPEEQAGEKGVVVGHQTRLGMLAHYKVDDGYEGRFQANHAMTVAETGHDAPDQVGAIVLLRKGEATLPALTDIEAKVKDLNDPASGRLLPGVQIAPYYDRRELTDLTTQTVTENLLIGMSLVTMILLLFLSNVRAALIVAINIPLALLFAFASLFLRGKSANLLSIGAVDFGIIVDSSVIIVENIYRHLGEGESANVPLKDRILHAAGEIDHPLFFSTLIMVCAFIPLFTLQGPAGALFGPMAETYAAALAAALTLALMLSPVLCMLLLKNQRPTPDNLFVRFIKWSYLTPLGMCLRHRWLTVAFFLGLLLYTLSLLPSLGREFMPELEEGTLWIRGTGPMNIALARQAAISQTARAIMASYPEVTGIVNQIGRTDDGTDTGGYYNSEFFVPLRPEKRWPAVVSRKDWPGWWGDAQRPRTKSELISQMDAELKRRLPGVDWNFSETIRDNVMEALSGVKGDNSLKIIGPDVDQLQKLGLAATTILRTIPGLKDVGLFSILGQSHLEFRADPEKCQRWGVRVADVNNVAASALGGQAVTVMVEGAKRFDVAIRWPPWLRGSETSILDIPVDIANNAVVPSPGPGFVPSASGSGQASPAPDGSLANTANPLSSTPRLRLRDLVSPVGEDGTVDPKGHFEKPGASVISREQAERLIAVKFSVRGRDLASAIEEARAKVQRLFKPPYRTQWSGEFEEMRNAERRLMWFVPGSLGLIFLLLYSALKSWVDTVVVFGNVVAMAMGGVWALFLTGTNFSISAAVGFISLFGVSIMDGLLLISYFNILRSQGKPLQQAIMEGAAKRVRPMMMTDLTALCGLLPAALSTRIGSQTQQPLAIVVVGGMATMLLLTRYLAPVLYSFYGHRQPPATGTTIAH